MIDYKDRAFETKWNHTLNIISQGFTTIFILESLLKIIAMGFIGSKYSYLRDPWNILDFIIVITG